MRRGERLKVTISKDKKPKGKPRNISLCMKDRLSSMRRHEGERKGQKSYSKRKGGQ